MIREYVDSLAVQVGIHLSDVKVVEGRSVGCLDVHLLHLIDGQNQVSTLVYQSELDNLHSGSSCKPLDKRIQAGLSRLQAVSKAENKSAQGRKHA